MGISKLNSSFDIKNKWQILYAIVVIVLLTPVIILLDWSNKNLQKLTKNYHKLSILLDQSNKKLIFWNTGVNCIKLCI